MTASTGVTLDVRAFGAVGDGRTDDAPAIQRSIEALPAVGGTVLIPAGVYLLTRPAGTDRHFPNGTAIGTAILLNRDRVQLKGSGPSTVLELGPRTKERVVTISGSGDAIENMTINGNGANRDGRLPWPDGDVVDALVYSDGAVDLKLSSCNVVAGIEDGIGIIDSQRVEVRGCDARNNGTATAGGSGIAIRDSSGVSVVASTIVSNSAGGVVVSGQSAGIQISGSQVRGNAKAGISLQGDNLHASDNTVTGNGRLGFVGISVVDANHGTLVNNEVFDNWNAGIRLGGDTSQRATDWLVIDNRCSNRSPDRVQKIGVLVTAAASQITLRGNDCEDNGFAVGDQIVVQPGADLNADWQQVNVVAYRKPPPRWLTLVAILVLVLITLFLVRRFARRGAS